MRPPVPLLPRPRRLSIELTRRCSKACCFCYNGSQPEGETRWTLPALDQLLRDAVAHGVEAVSFGGGEPLESPLLLPILRASQGLHSGAGPLRRSLTSNGLWLDAQWIRAFVELAVDRVHLSIHFPGNAAEVTRVMAQVERLRGAGLAVGVNLLVRQSTVASATAVAEHLRAREIEVVYLPMRGGDTPSAEAVGRVAGARPFQSMSCLLGCAASAPFVSVGWDRRVGWCSYTAARRPLREPTYAGLVEALRGELRPCGPIEAGVIAMPKQPLAAAHSMDSDWYAVDGDGCVALFETYEQGELPLRYQTVAGADLDWYGVRDLLQSAGLPLDHEALDRWDQGAMLIADSGGLRPVEAGELAAKAIDIDSALLVFREPDVSHRAGHALLSGLGSVEWIAAGVVVRGGVHRDWVLELPEWLAGSVLRLAIVTDQRYPELRLFGLYQYECWAGGERPYNRVASPERPLRINRLPTPVRELARVAPLLGLQFADAPQLSLRDHFACSGYGGTATDRPPPLCPSWRGPSLALDATARALISAALDPSIAPERLSVLVDWLIDRGHPLGSLLRSKQRAFPEVLDLLPAEAQHRLACEAYRMALPALEQLTADDRAQRALQAKEAWLDGRIDLSGLLAAHETAAEATWGAAVSASEPRLVDVLNEASWLAAAASDDDWDVARAAAIQQQVNRARDLLEG